LTCAGSEINGVVAPRRVASVRISTSTSGVLKGREVSKKKKSNVAFVFLRLKNRRNTPGVGVYDP